MSFAAPLAEIESTLAFAIADGKDRPGSEAPEDSFREVLTAAARYAETVLAPLNAPGDRIGARFDAGAVATPPGWRDAYGLWRTGGWAGMTAPESAGGAGLPLILGAACYDMWNAANMSFMLAPLLSSAAIEALAAHAAPELKSVYLAKLVSGEWTAAMSLTEPQAGSDLAGVRTRAVPAGDGSYHLIGQKIFITYGEHDLTPNNVHLVLARLPGAPAGTRGLSLFIAPKFLPDEAGRPGMRNDLKCVGLERKLGIHGAPTCTMNYGDDGGARAWLVGEPNRGLACMFTMMNNARLAVGLQGVGLCEAATQRAFAYARERRQGRASAGGEAAPIIAHPDVRRMLLTMKASTAAGRSICYLAAAAIDRGREAPDDPSAFARAGLLIPVAKAFASDLANETTSLAIQVHGGMGYIEETGVAQLMRDARVAAIYEGTNGVQAMDLVQRKLASEGGAAARFEIAAVRRAAARVKAVREPSFGRTAELLAKAAESLERATDWMLATHAANPPAALAGASPYLRLFGLARGGAALAEMAVLAHARALAAEEPAEPVLPAKEVGLARFFAEHMAVGAGGLELAITQGSQSILTNGQFESPPEADARSN